MKLLIGAVSIAVLLAACGSGSDSHVAPATIPSTVEGVQAPPAGQEIDCADRTVRQAIFLSLLTRVPLNQETAVEVYYDDYECWRQLLRIDLPAPDAPASEILAYRDALLARAYIWDFEGHLAGFSMYFDLEAWSAELGFDVSNVDQNLYAGIPPRQLFILRGRFDVERVDSAVHSDPARSDQLEVIPYSDKIQYYKWSEDYQQDLGNRTLVRPTGRGGRLAASDGFVLWAYGNNEIEGAIDASLGHRTSLASLPGYRQLADAIFNIGALSFTASFFESMSIRDTEIAELILNEYGEEKVSRLRQEGILDPFIAMAVGSGYESGRAYAVLLYLYPDETSAQANAAILDNILEAGHSLSSGELWKDEIELSEVGTLGPVLFTRIWSDNPLIGVEAYNNLDGLVLSK